MKSPLGVPPGFFTDYDPHDRMWFWKNLLRYWSLFIPFWVGVLFGVSVGWVVWA